MAATVSLDVLSGKDARIFDVKGDTSYATGGYAVSLSAFGAGGGVRAAYGVNDGSTVIALFDSVNLKVKFITAATGAEVANASDQSANTVKLVVV